MYGGVPICHMNSYGKALCLPLPYEFIWQTTNNPRLGRCHMNSYGKATSFPPHMNHMATPGEQWLLEDCHMNSYGNGKQADHSAAARAQRAEVQAFAATPDDKLILLRGVS